MATNSTHSMYHCSFQCPAVLDRGMQGSDASIHARPLLHQISPVRTAQPASSFEFGSVRANALSQSLALHLLGLQVDQGKATEVPLDAPLDSLIRVSSPELPPSLPCRPQVEQMLPFVPSRLLGAAGCSFAPSCCPWQALCQSLGPSSSWAAWQQSATCPERLEAKMAAGTKNYQGVTHSKTVWSQWLVHVMLVCFVG